jgi:NADH dehydrogenase
MSSLVTVFGGSGFVGRYAVRALAGAGHRIRGGVRRPNLGNYLIPMGAVGQIQLVKADVTDEASVAAALRGSTAVVNLVGVLYESGHQRFQAIHADAAAAIASAAKAAGVETFVHVSAAGAAEDSESSYARTKAEGERRVREAFPAATILRPSLVFGPEDNFFNRFAALARLFPVLPLIGGGHTRFQPAYVGDVGEAIAFCLANSATAGRTYELGGPRVYTFRQLLELILIETNRRRWLVPLPFPLAMLKAHVLQLLPNPLLTCDQVRLLRHDSVVAADALTFADLGIEPDCVEAIVPAYLWRFRRGGQFDANPRVRLSALP